MRLDRHSMPPPSWIALGRNDNLMALEAASTLWFSLDSEGKFGRFAMTVKAKFMRVRCIMKDLRGLLGLIYSNVMLINPRDVGEDLRSC